MLSQLFKRLLQQDIFWVPMTWADIESFSLCVRISSRFATIVI